MTRYLIIEENVTVDTSRATASFAEATRFDGRNHVSLATNSQWEHETLYRSRKGRWYVEYTSQWHASTDYAAFIDDREAALWLLTNEHELPEDLQAFTEEVSE